MSNIHVWNHKSIKLRQALHCSTRSTLRLYIYTAPAPLYSRALYKTSVEPVEPVEALRSTQPCRLRVGRHRRHGGACVTVSLA